VAWFGGVGRFVSVLVIVIAAAGAITSALPIIGGAASVLAVARRRMISPLAAPLPA
jgi:hypothetical protein